MTHLNFKEKIKGGGNRLKRKLITHFTNCLFSELCKIKITREFINNQRIKVIKLGQPYGQSYKYFTIGNYDSRVVIWAGTFVVSTTQES